MATKRKAPGTGGSGKFYRILVRSEEEFAADTESWLVSKDDADLRNGKLVITNPKVKASLAKAIRGPMKHVKGDIFHAYPK